MIHIRFIWEKKTDISFNEVLDNDKAKDVQIPNGIFDIINKRINVIINNNTGVFNNQLRMESSEKKIQNEYYKMELKQQFNYIKAHQDQIHFNYYQIILQMFYVQGREICCDCFPRYVRGGTFRVITTRLFLMARQIGEKYDARNITAYSMKKQNESHKIIQKD